MQMQLTQGERGALESAARYGHPGYVRTKALALLNVADGRTVCEVAAIFRVSRQTVYAWCRRWRAEGLGGLRVHAGRGRSARADLAELDHYLRQSPRRFELRQTRWTLAALGRQRVTHAHPWCDDFSEFRRQVMHELGRLAQGSAELLRYVGLST